MRGGYVPVVRIARTEQGDVVAEPGKGLLDVTIQIRAQALEQGFIWLYLIEYVVEFIEVCTYFEVLETLR